MASSTGMRVLIKQRLIEPNSNKNPEPRIERVRELQPEEVVDLNEINELYGSTVIDDEENEDEIEERSYLEVSDGDFSKPFDIEFDEFGKTEARIVEPQFKLGLAELLDEKKVVPLFVCGNSEVEISGILHDSRVVESRGLFVCCVRRKTNGHLYLYEPDKRGSVAVVEDTIVILAALAASFFKHPHRSISMIGIKLINWKTTASLLIKGIYKSVELRTGMLSTIANYGHGDNKAESIHGTPDAVLVQKLMAKIVHNGTEALIMEASSHALALGRRDEVDFDISLHRKILNLDDLNTMFFIARGNPYVPILTFAVENKNGHAHSLKFGLPLCETQVLVNMRQGIMEISLGLLGWHNICNIISSVAVRAPLEDIVGRIEEVAGWYGLISEEQAFRVIVDFAHTPDALSRLLVYVSELAPWRILTVFGCVGETDRGKRPMMTKIVTDKSDATILISDNPRNEDPSTMANWAGLPYDLLVSIIQKIKMIEDFVVFRFVCKSWREAASDDKCLRCPRVPWLILPEKPEDADYHRQIYSLSKKNTLTKNLYVPEMSNKRCIGLNYGWVLTISQRHGEMNLVHPLSLSVTKLPPQTSIEDYNRGITWPSYLFTRKAALSGNPSKSSDFVLMIAHNGGFHLGYWRPGDTGWTRVEQEGDFCDVIYYQDQFYAITCNGSVWGFRVDDLIVVRRVMKIDTNLISSNCPYIVGSARGLLVLVRQEHEEYGGREQPPVVAQENDDDDVDDDDNNLPLDDACEYWVTDFQVYELDLIHGGYKQIKNLGDEAIFVGHNTSISLVCASELLGIKSNCIYFTDDCDIIYTGQEEGGGKDMGYYSLEDAQITQIKVDPSLSRINPPFWFSYLPCD